MPVGWSLILMSEVWRAREGLTNHSCGRYGEGLAFSFSPYAVSLFQKI